MTTTAEAKANSPPTTTDNEQTGNEQDMPLEGPAAAAQLLARSLMGMENRRSGSASGSDASLSGAATPASTQSLSRSSSLSQHQPQVMDEPAEQQPPPNMDELNELMQELHRHQLWFGYVLGSTRKQMENMDEDGFGHHTQQMEQTLTDLSHAVEVVTATKRRMLNVQQRMERMKASIMNWRIKQISNTNTMKTPLPTNVQGR